MSASRRAAAVPLLLALTLLAGACQSDGSSTHPPGDDAGRDHASTTTTTSLPADWPYLAADQVHGHGTTSVDQTMRALAGVGIATVAGPTSTAPLVPVSGTQVSEITRDMAQTLADQASSGAGVLGSGMDGVLPLGPNAPFTITQLIGGWVVAAPDQAARTAADLTGTVDWTHPDEVVLTGEVVDLFVGDLAQHAATAGGSTSASPASLASPAAYEPRLTGDPLSNPCSTIDNFIHGTLDALFDAIHINPNDVQAYISGHVGGFAGTLLGWLGRFGADIVNGLADVLHQTINQVIAFFTKDFMGYLTGAIGVLYAVQSVLDLIRDAHATVTADPTSNRVSIGNESRRTGLVTASVPDNDSTAHWPPQIADCAQLGDLKPPTLTTRDAPTYWHPGSLPDGLVTVDSPSPPSYEGIVGANITDSLHYYTGHQDKEEGQPYTSPWLVKVDLERSQVKQLRDLVDSLIAKTGVLAPYVRLVVRPVLDLVVHKLHDFTMISGSTTIGIVSWGKDHQPDLTCTSGSTIPAGSYRADHTAGVLHVDERVTLKGAPFLVAESDNAYNGTVSLTSDGSTVKGSMALTGSTYGGGTADIGVPLRLSGRGTMRGRIYGPASSPKVRVTMAGSWSDNDPLGGEHSGSGTYTLTTPLHASADCASVHGDIKAIWQDVIDQVIAKANTKPEVHVALTLSGNDTWVALKQ